jgi:UDP-glucose 4-epimerase
MKKYLITGGQGFIGSKIITKTGGSSFDLKSGQNILNTDQLTGACNDMTGIFHCAAKISVPESVEKPDEYFKTNVEGTRTVVNVADGYKTKIVFSSSAAVYGEKNEKVNEDADLHPQSPYAQNKVDGEVLLAASPVPHIALRYFNVYGPGQSPQYAGVITFFIMNALTGKDLVIYGDGNQVRDFIFVDDIAKANVLAMQYPNTVFEIFNIGSGRETSIKELAETIIALTQSSSKIIYKDPRPGDIIYSQADVSKARTVLNWNAETSLEEGLRQTIAYYKHHTQQ